MLSLLCASLLLWAQDPTVHLVQATVPGVRLQSVAVALDGPVDEALCRYRELVAASVLPAGSTHGIEVVHGELVVFRAEFAADDAAPGAAWLTTLLGKSNRPDADLAELAVGRAALAADDAAWLQPGSVFRTQMLRRLLPEQAPGCVGWLPDPQQVAARDLGELTAAPLRARAVAIAWVGGHALPPSVVATDLAAALGPVASGTAPVLGSFAPDLPREEAQHARVAGPFVALGFRTPVPAPPALALGIEVLRTRALRTFQAHRGGEDRALAPYVAWSWVAGDPLLRLHRRGPKSVPRPGEDGSAPRWQEDAQHAAGELDALLGELVQHPPTAREVGSAARLLQAELVLPPWGAAMDRSLAEAPEGLRARARVMALAALRGWTRSDLDALGAVPPGAVAEALEQVLVGTGRWSGVLHPAAGSLSPLVR
ncbi:MAG: hypothetical protein RL148_140 [Planctomycetota bacterium]